MKKIIALILSLAMLCACLTSCGGGNTSAGPSSGSATTPSSAAEPDNTPDEPDASGENVFSFGLIAQFSNGIGLGMYNALVAWVDHLNNAGGVQIGETTYQLNMIAYDSDGNTDTAGAAVERLIHEDKVDYIISDTNIVDSWLHTCEENEVVALVETASTDMYANDWQYIYEVGAKNAMAAAMDTWYYTNEDISNVICLYPDSASGETDSALAKNILTSTRPDLEITMISYPSDSTDLSAVATKVVMQDPDVFMPVGGGPNAIGNAVKAVRDAGYEGPIFSTSPFTASVLMNFVDAASAQGFVNCALPTEFDEPLTDLAAEFKQAYIDYYGEWDSPEVVASVSFFALIAALQAAGTTDKDAVREQLNNGLEWEAPVGNYKMIARSDYNMTRTCDSVSDYYIKTIDADGKPVLVDHIDIDTAQAAVEAYFDYLAG